MGEKKIYNVFDKHVRIIFVKSSIANKLGIPYEKQRLIYEDIVLEDCNTLGDYFYGSQKPLHLFIRRANEFQIFVKSSEKVLTLFVEPTELIKETKLKICQMANLPTCTHSLFSENQELNDFRLIQDYSIHEFSLLLIESRLTKT
jgi:hypothetical protein